MPTTAGSTAERKLNSFQRAWEYACRRSERAGYPQTIVRTGLVEQPFLVTTTPDDDAEIAAQVMP
ncbi:hypothetical protein [Sphingopyxis granuli]|uniref:Uncharacterized protein n=1 Tax=Rhizorhabdus wittichii TaxID=160791 RepID=A0A975DB39_9SPHN|nr:hypothetical protein [Sphingopyxis granuli]QTH24880.1 hypothetical protein HRJ34_27840 [Rhizorhabdus wittichii]